MRSSRVLIDLQLSELKRELPPGAQGCYNSAGMLARDKKHIAVIGGSIAGLGAALVLSQEGHRVTVLERDATPLPDSPLEAFETWDRRGAPQVRHSHAFLARLYGILRRRAPTLLEELFAHGAEELRFEDLARQTLNRIDLELEPEDQDLRLIACRRITFEWVLRRHVEGIGHVSFRDGVEVTGLAATPCEASAPPRVSGVHLRLPDGARETLAADLVLDGSGRRTQLPAWLAAIGAGPLEKDSEPCGIFYCSRFYRVKPGAEKPALGGVAAADLGYLKLGIFPGDSGIFSVTMCASPHDDDLRRIVRTPFFEAAAAVLPQIRDWVDPDLSEPITDVHAMSNLENTRRFFVRNGQPVALGVYPIGDALIHTNPLNGRGCTLAWVNAELVAQALSDHPHDPLAFARALDTAIERELVPWYASTLAQDRDAIAMTLEQQRGEDPYAYQREDGTVDFRRYMRSLLRDGLIPAMREDIVILRAFMRVFNLLAPPQDLLKNPVVTQRALAAFGRKETRESVPEGPSRNEMIEHLRDVRG